jgi:multicomponent Na+:H+ antiporter subunit G|tara:strand:+ start:1714 stop:2052 length:339 start_codon:yes stop_codon:yes gene_type:complete
MPLSEFPEAAQLLISIVAAGLILVGLFFLFVAAIGVLRLPDVFTRAHAVSLTDSVGALFLLSGLALYQGFTINLVRILIVMVLLYLLNPVIAHATVRSANRSGVEAWTREDS